MSGPVSILLVDDHVENLLALEAILEPTGHTLVRAHSGDEALKAVAEQALERGTGARGLRSILETALLPTMYELPSRSDIAKCVVDADTVHDGVQPTLVTGSGRSEYDYDEETA